MSLVVIFTILIFLYSLVSGKLEKSILTAPILFTTMGIIASLVYHPAQVDVPGLDTFLIIAEIGLVLLLFTDASRTNLRKLNATRNLPIRLLGIGLLLTIILGALLAHWIFPALSVWEAGILAAILAPTDAGLGQIIVNSPRLPLKIRQALNVEAGLNDGLSVPFLLFFIAMASSTDGTMTTRLASFIVAQLGYGTIVGIAIGLAGGWLLTLSHQRQWLAESSRQLGVVALPVLCLFASEAVGASMFIAAFVAGLAVQIRFKDAGKHSVEFAEEWGQLLNLSVFFLFGLLAMREWQNIEWQHALYGVLSLTVIRMLPVMIALIGTRMSRPTRLFMGWFGPRGLASIVLGLVYLEHAIAHSAAHSGLATIRLAVICTVMLSIFAHGLSALPGMAAYARALASLPPGSPDTDGD